MEDEIIYNVTLVRELTEDNFYNGLDFAIKREALSTFLEFAFSNNYMAVVDFSSSTALAPLKQVSISTRAHIKQ